VSQLSPRGGLAWHDEQERRPIVVVFGESGTAGLARLSATSELSTLVPETLLETTTGSGDVKRIVGR
jgi:hypothetical protein